MRALAGVLFALVGWGLGVSTHAGEIWRCTGKDGVITLSNQPPPTGQQRGCKVIHTSSPSIARPGGREADRGVAASVAPVRPAQEAPAGAPAVVARMEGACANALYTWRQNGQAHFSNLPPPAGAQQVRRLSCVSGRPPERVAKLDLEAFAPVLRQISRESGVNEALLRAVMHAESGFNPNAISPKGAMGLMQLIPATASRFGVSDAYDPEQNVRGGAAYLRFLLDRFPGRIDLALAAYNAGEGAVDRYRGIPPYAETQDYVQKVQSLYGRYLTALGSQAQVQDIGEAGQAVPRL